MKLFLALAILCLTAIKASAGDEKPVEFTLQEKQMIVAHGPWPLAMEPDSSNRYSGSDVAIAFGQRLFNDTRLSSERDLSCATCHKSSQSFADGMARSVGRNTVDRNTPSLANLRLNRWFGWSGGADTLWGQSVRPLQDEKEHNLTPDVLVERIAEDETLLGDYAQAFGAGVFDHEPELVMANVGKALAAWQETLKTPRTVFDQFRDVMAVGGTDYPTGFSLSAQRGLKLFVGKAKCSICHFGPNFTNGEFHDIGLSYFIEDGRVDSGRYAGIQTFQDTPFTRAGKYSDERPETAQKAPGQFVQLQHRNWGEFRVPSLRNVTNTAPYMHNGSLQDLNAVIDHYSTMDLERLHINGESLLQPLGLSDDDVSDLIAFLHSLSGAPSTQ